MATIEKMSVQGIRSFGPDDADKQIVQFFFPLTLILGPNGTGKTTIIECLRYMTTGELPPGAARGACFIHDPKIAREREVKAQVRLQFHDVKGEMCVVQRSLTATQKNKKVEMKTLEGLLTRRKPDGEKYSISTRCAEMDREMVSLLGVSKSVLENVIFCHQEDSTWPLSEGKTLKQKFDDIFASTRYVKALDSIRKCRQEQMTEVKLYQNDIKYLKMNKEKAAQVSADLREAESKYLASKDNVDKIVQELSPIQDKLEQINSKAGELQKTKTQLEKLKSEKNQMERYESDLQGKIKNHFQGSVHELRRQLDQFQEQVNSDESAMKQSERDVHNVGTDLARYNQEKTKLLVEQGKLQQEAMTHKENIEKRNKKVCHLAKEYHLEKDYQENLKDAEAVEFLHLLESDATEILSEASKQKLSFEDKERLQQLEIDKLRASKTTLETQYAMKHDKMIKDQEAIRNINRNLSQVESDAEREQYLEINIARTDRDITEVEKSVDVAALKAEVLELQNQKMEFEIIQKKLDAEMSRMSLESIVRSQLELLQKEKSNKEDYMRRLRAKNEDSLCHLLGSMPEENIKRVFEEYVSTLSGSLQKNNKELEKSRTKLTELESNRKHSMEQLQVKEEELKGFHQRMFNACENDKFEDGFAKVEEDLKKAQDMKGYVQGSEIVLKKYRSDLGRDDPACPLCHRPFDSPDEVNELIDELQRKLNLVPQKLTQVNETLEKKKDKYEELLQLKPVLSSMKNLMERDIPDLKCKIQTFTSEIDVLKNIISEKDEEVETLQSDKATADSIQGDVVMIDRCYVELKDLAKRLAQQSSKLSTDDSSRTLQMVANEQKKNRGILEDTSNQLERKRDRITCHIEQVQRLRSQLQELREERVKIQTQLKERSRLEDEKVALRNEVECLQVEVQEIQEELKPLELSINKVMKAKDEIVSQKSLQDEKFKEKYRAIKENLQFVEQLQQKIERYTREGRENKLIEIEEKMGRHDGKVTSIEQKKAQIEKDIEEFRKKISSQRLRERELLDNLTLKEKQSEIKEITQRIAQLEADLEGLDVTNLEKERRTLVQRREQLETKKHQSEGRQRGYEDEIIKFKRELNEDIYKDAELKYGDKMIALKTTELASSDLDKYYKALDRTIMNYHKQKMEEINKIIRELWRNTYRGNDIDTIEIQSDEDESGGAAKLRRTYNYRVVMRKGEVDLDMRGRCSAGQKVLASLIIRLALAETFCLNCGILALDEPTTNLDRENIESLSYALVEIIKSRMRQKNFQLVVITHDEDFVELLGRSDYVEEFFKVSKNQFGCSQLKKARVEDLHQH